MSWIFQESDPMGGAAGEAYANTLKSPGMRPEHVLAREAIQNSVDAGVNGKVLVRFRYRLVSGGAKQAFVEAAKLRDIGSRTASLELATPNCLQTLAAAKASLSLLYVEDHNTVGLNGEAHDKGSNFFRLLLSLGDRSKGRDRKGTGGSYGFGKSVYSSSSAIQTIFAYTRFLDAGGHERVRLFGCGYYASHEFRGQNYSGRAWLGSKRRTDDAGREIVDPLEGSAADKLAHTLGFTLRGRGELGTSILIPDAVVDLQEVIRGVEDWWWPRLIEHRLDVEVIDPSDRTSVPRPKKNEQLRPFIEAFDIARQRAQPTSKTQKYNRLASLGAVPLGGAGFVVVPLGATGPVVRTDRCNAVALIRAPLMVVSYKSFSETAPLVVGAYVASEEVDVPLKKSEPPNHDRWDPDSANLRDEQGTERELVKAVLSRIKAGLKRFQTEASPPAPPKQRRLTVLERALGSYFKPQSMGPPRQPEAEASALHLEFNKPPYPEPTRDGMLRLKSTFTVTLDQAAEDDEVDLRLRVRCPVLEDDNEEGDDLPVSVDVKGVAARVDSADPQIYRFSLGKGEKARFTIQSQAYDPAWTVRLRPEIEEELAP